MVRGRHLREGTFELRERGRYPGTWAGTGRTRRTGVQRYLEGRGKQNGAMNRLGKEGVPLAHTVLRSAQHRLHSTDRYRAGLAWAPPLPSSLLHPPSCLSVSSRHPIAPCLSVSISASASASSHGLKLCQMTMWSATLGVTLEQVFPPSIGSGFLRLHVLVSMMSVSDWAVSVLV